jgi:hypothetical protein
MLKNKFLVKGLIFAVVFASLFLYLPSKARAVEVRWTGNGLTNNWSEDANWQGGIAPADTDDVVIDGTSKNVVIDTDTYATSLTITSGFTGNIVQEGNFECYGDSVMDGANWEINGNNLNLDFDATLTLNSTTINDLSTTGNTVFATYGDWLINQSSSVNFSSASDVETQNVTVNNSSINFIHSGDAFFGVGHDLVLSDGEITLAGSLTLLITGNLSQSGSSSIRSSGEGSLDLESYGVWSLTGTSSVDFNSLSRVGIIVYSQVAFSARASATFPSNSQLDLYSGISLSDSADFEFPADNLATMTLYSDFLMTGGTFIAPSKLVPITNLSITGGNFNANGGDVMLVDSQNTIVIPGTVRDPVYINAPNVSFFNFTIENAVDPEQANMAADPAEVFLEAGFTVTNTFKDQTPRSTVHFANQGIYQFNLLDIQGTAESMVSLTSEDPDTQLRISNICDVLSYVNIENLDASSGKTIFVTGGRGIDGGGNHGWNFDYSEGMCPVPEVPLDGTASVAKTTLNSGPNITILPETGASL